MLLHRQCCLTGRGRRQGRHGVDQILYLGIGQGMAIGGLHRRHVIGRAGEPSRHGDAVGGADHRDLEVVGSLLEPQLVDGDAAAEQQFVAIEVEARLPNKDIAFVEVGQEAVIKIDAFPFTRYGTISGKITTVSLDAVQDEQKKEYYFPIRVALDRAAIGVENGKQIPMTPGMTVAAEVRTGTRKAACHVDPSPSFWDGLTRFLGPVPSIWSPSWVLRRRGPFRITG